MNAPCSNCGGSGSVDSGGVTPWGAPIDLPCPSCKSKWDELVIIGASWKKDSSLDKWFPISAEELKSLRAEVASLRVGSEDRRPDLPPVKCGECGGDHEPSGARYDCIRHWKLRALQAEDAALVQKVYGGQMGTELRVWLDHQVINSDNIGAIRRRCFVPWDSAWNELVRNETAEREVSSK